MRMIEKAIELAAVAHAGQTRKGTDIPYITHPYMVGTILLAAGCSEEVVTAGILHDTVEDTYLTLQDIKEQFGARVAEIVAGCSEPDKSKSWEERKQHSIKALNGASREIKLVACADKLANIRDLAAGYVLHGDEVWNRFKRGKEKQAWYYRGMVDSLSKGFRRKAELEILSQLKDEVEELFAGVLAL